MLVITQAFLVLGGCVVEASPLGSYQFELRRHHAMSKGARLGPLYPSLAPVCSSHFQPKQLSFRVIFDVHAIVATLGIWDHDVGND